MGINRVKTSIKEITTIKNLLAFKTLYQNFYPVNY